MEQKITINSVCLQVFAKISASISHEIKNTLSIINENAGLLEDLANLAGAERAIPIDQVQPIASTIMKQVNRSNIIMKDLNRFAHSGDAPQGRMNMADLLALMVALTSRQAAMKSIVVEMSSPANLVVCANLVVLESLLYLLLRRVYDNVASATHLLITGEQVDEKLMIGLKFDGISYVVPDIFPDESESVLAAHLDASCLAEKETIILTLPV